MKESGVIKNFLYQDLSDSVEKELAYILGKITHHIHPDIVSYIVQENVRFKRRFEEFCHEKLNVSPFFYSGSDCVFPGFRRPINKEKSEQWKNNVYEADGTILNDNTFPRHIWAFLSMDRAYSGGTSGMWSSSGLDRFELAHVFGHKQDERELEQEVFHDYNGDIQPYGLFTSASNIVLIPKGFAKPTDHMRSIKVCFYKRHIDLYGNNLIGLNNLKESCVPDWYDEIQWLEPQLVDGWEQKIDNLLKYREKYLENKYDSKKPQSIQIHQVTASSSNKSPDIVNNKGCLPITLDPADPDIFKQDLLVSKLAVIETYYTDGRVERKPWNATKFSESSNVFGNLRSRPEYRSGNWQSRDIVKVHVKIENND
jgi:hypothetical protein